MVSLAKPRPRERYGAGLRRPGSDAEPANKNLEICASGGAVTHNLIVDHPKETLATRGAPDGNGPAVLAGERTEGESEGGDCGECVACEHTEIMQAIWAGANK